MAQEHVYGLQLAHAHMGRKGKRRNSTLAMLGLIRARKNLFRHNINVCLSVSSSFFISF